MFTADDADWDVARMRTVPNFLGADGDPRRAWTPEVLERLTAVKRDVDPQSVIRSNRSISG